MLDKGRPQLAIPGPSIIPDAVLQSMQRPSPNIYGGELVEMSVGLYPDLCRVAGTAGDAVILIGNGHAAWECALVNALRPGDRVLAPSTGRFGAAWAEMATQLGIEVDQLDSSPGTQVDPDAVAAHLRQHPDTRAVISTQTDTSSSVRTDVRALRGAIDEAGSSALLMVDAIASLGCEAMAMDDWGVDVLVAACQKGLMTPAGLAFNFIGPRGWAARQRDGRVSPYWDWDTRVNGKVFHQRFCGTPPTHHLYALRTALDLMLDEGLEAIWRRHASFAAAVWAAVEHWGQQGPFGLYVPATEERSHAVTTVTTAGASAARLREWTEAHTGVTLGIGLPLDGPTWGDKPDNLFRIGHMGHLSAAQLLGTLASIELALRALGIEHCPGAVEAAGAALAGSLDRG